MDISSYMHLCVSTHVCVRTCSRLHVCVCRCACLSTCMCMYFPGLSSGANRCGEDADCHRRDRHRRRGGEPGAGSRGSERQQRSDGPGRHSQDRPEPLRKQGNAILSVRICSVVSHGRLRFMRVVLRSAANCKNIQCTHSFSSFSWKGVASLFFL